GCEPGDAVYSFLDGPRDDHCITQQRTTRRDIEERFIERQTFDDRGELTKHAEDLSGHRHVVLHSRLDAYGMRPQTQRRAHRHGGMHAELANLVARGSHDATTARAAHDDGLSLQAGIVALFDGRVE